MLNPLSFISKLFSSGNKSELKKLNKILQRINELEAQVSRYKDDDFPEKTKEFKRRLDKKETLDDLLPEAFALAREASKRSRGERHFDVQILGGISLHQGKIAEMKTGEGKTITIALAAYLNSLKGEGVHIVTVNDYLAKRDCEDMSKIYNFLGISAGFVTNEQDEKTRSENYSYDITK